METNYELKHKCLLVPLKAALLVLAMVLIGFTTYAQQGKSVKVATDQQLIEAIGNPSVGTIELASGYYSYLSIGFTEGSKITKGVTNNGNRAAGDCTYLIIDGKFCFDPDLDLPEFDSYDPPAGYNEGIASANTDEATCIPPFSGCCPPPDDGGAGFWSVSTAPNATPPGATVVFDPTTPLSQNFNKRFFVDKPGRYLIGYTWPSTNSFAFTEYLFFGPGDMELSAPDVCGLTTEVTFLLDPGFRLPTDPGVVAWTLTPYATGIPQPYAGPSTSDVFDLTVDECGLWQICVTYSVIKTLDDFGVPTEYCEKTICIDVEFACEPIADAGPDVNVCGDLCAFLDGAIYSLTEVSPSFAYSWVNINGPQGQTLNFSPNGGVMTEDVTACREPYPPTCSYGEYEVQFQVYNGYADCADDDNAIVRFYEQPTADAGPDQHLCNTFSFSLAAVPFGYCGVEGVNYWSTSFWTVVSKADPAAVITFTPDEFAPNATVTITSSADCAYGAYEFMWSEENSKGVRLGGCYDDDNVVVTIYEVPVPDAGEDLVLCNTFAFSLWGTGDTPCYTYTDVVYSWEKTAQPGECVVTITGPGTLNPQIEITSCATGSCPYGEYIFELTQSNGYYNGNTFEEVCSGTDEVSVWIFEPVDADAGVDQHICNSFAFTMTAVPTAFCGSADTNYFSWGEWEFVSGPSNAVTIDDVNDPVSGVTIDGLSVPCPYGVYIFKWTEYNGMGTPFEGCWGEDFVYIYIDETPESISAGPDFALCNEFVFDLDGAVDMPCTDNTAYSIMWELMSQPDMCHVMFSDVNAIDPVVTIAHCGSCQFGEYTFKVTQLNGYYDDAGAFIEVCRDSDEVSVWIFEEPTEVDAGPEQLLCNDYTFDLVGSHAAFCGDAGVDYMLAYSWRSVSQPVDAGCTVTITNGTTLTPSVVVDNCTGECAYGEFVFEFTVTNGNTLGYCDASDLVSIFIFEAPDADAGEDIAGCFDIGLFPYCTDMSGSLEYCYSMVGVWTKTCGPGGVTFTDLNDAESEVCFAAPGLYKFTWTAWNAAEGCMDEEEVVFTLLEQPVATGLYAELEAPCDDLCIDLGLAGIDKYEYTGTAAGDCPNFGDEAYWSFISGPSTEVTFADDTDPETEFCVSVFGGYTIRWYEVNRIDDQVCTDWFDVYVEFNETPEPLAMGGEICGNCFTLDGTLDASLTGTFYWEFVSGPCAVTFDPLVIDPVVCIEDVAACYGTYEFILHQWNGRCEGTATATITFYQLPPALAICFDNEPNFCGEIPDGFGGPRGFTYNGCLEPNDVLEVCAEGCTEFYLGPWCECLPGFDWSDPLTFHWTFEWSYTGPTGTIQSSSPGYYDFMNGHWVYPYFNICWGECCDTARIYLTINTGECELDLEYKAYVHHKPCIDIVGPDVAEVGMVSTYCNDCEIPVGDEDCYLYTWTAEHCGEIVGGQGTPCIDVLWTDYNVNGGWGQITLTVFDICTGCCNFDEMPVKIWPAGTLGSATLSGHVYYENNSNSPLNGVEIQLWNGGIPVMSTTSFNDIEGGNGPGYYEFSGINGLTPFGVTASYDAPWYGANATDALAVELKTINNLPGGFVFDDVVAEAMNVNDLNGINGTDALWIKQRAINMVNFFPAGNWAFDPTMQTQAVVGFDIFALNMGDANRSNIPAAGKSAPAIDLLTVGTMNVVTNEVFELPIRIAKEEMFGAITLNLEYNPALIEVVEVASVEGMISNITSGNVSIAWSNVNPMVLAENDVVVTLKVKAISEITASEAMFRIGLGSEFADQSASVIEPVTLKTFGITTGPAATDYFLSTNRPNPFNTSTFIEYTMPESGKVRLSVLDMLGQEIAVLVEATQTAGSYTVEFSAAGLATGVYIYKITVDGETRDFSSTQRMVISH